ncbi:hypothetical protein HA402_009307 [Bradysia odoriphaga]|nr:hypothetical protein HA402_009307 [Bradysia odoriphaga]
MRRTVDYNVKVHINNRQCEIMKAECECPAGVGPNAACKHVSALIYRIEYYAVTAKCDSSLVRKKYCNVRAYFNDHDYCKDNIATIMLNELNAVTPAQIRKFEKKTRTNSKLWFQLRKTRITASIAHDVVRTCRTKRYASAFIKQHFLNKPIRSNALKWGITNEATALKKYCSVMNDDFYKCGTTIDRERNYLAASPDAVNRTHDTIVEIKCPYSVRYGKPERVQYLQSGSLKATHKYYTQMQIQMHVTLIHRCDFVVWTPQGILFKPSNMTRSWFLIN